MSTCQISSLPAAAQSLSCCSVLLRSVTLTMTFSQAQSSDIVYTATATILHCITADSDSTSTFFFSLSSLYLTWPDVRIILFELEGCSWLLYLVKYFTWKGRIHFSEDHQIIDEKNTVLYKVTKFSNSHCLQMWNITLYVYICTLAKMKNIECYSITLDNKRIRNYFFVFPKLRKSFIRRIDQLIIIVTARMVWSSPRHCQGQT